LLEDTDDDDTENGEDTEDYDSELSEDDDVEEDVVIMRRNPTTTARSARRSPPHQRRNIGEWQNLLETQLRRINSKCDLSDEDTDDDNIELGEDADNDDIELSDMICELGSRYLRTLVKVFWVSWRSWQL